MTIDLSTAKIGDLYTIKEVESGIIYGPLPVSNTLILADHPERHAVFIDGKFLGQIYFKLNGESFDKKYLINAPWGVKGSAPLAGDIRTLSDKETRMVIDLVDALSRYNEAHECGTLPGVLDYLQTKRLLKRSLKLKERLFGYLEF